ncbi:MAG TPA: condensation domain-containing protein, partial [Herpetosiphonaceae bacterium]
PLLRVGWYELGPAQGARVLVAAHHLVIDGVGWRILVGDLETAYTQARSGAAIALPPKTTDVQRWAEQLVAYAQRDTLRAEAAYWLATLQPPPRPLPVDDLAGEPYNTEATARTVTMVLPAHETTALLQQVPQIYHMPINDALLAALAQAYAQWSGASTLLLDLEGHGREDLFPGVDLSRTVGWFTTVYPVLLDIRQAVDLSAVLKSVKEQLRAIPNHGIGYGLLRYLSQDTDVAARLRELPQPQISFNYLGQFDAVLAQSALFRPASESIGPARSPSGRRSHLLEINAHIANEQLHVVWTYSERVHRRATVERFAHMFLAAMEAIVAHCQSPDAGGYTPSDFPEADLSQTELDELLTELGDSLEDWDE